MTVKSWGYHIPGREAVVFSIASDKCAVNTIFRFTFARSYFTS